MFDRLIQWARRFTPSGSVGEQAARSGVWAILLNVSDRALALGMVLVLGNILDPDDFGLFGIALLSLAAVRQFSNLGLDAALIQRREENVDSFLDTLWTMKIIRSGVIVTLAFVAAPYVAQFFNEPRVTNVFRAIALSPLLLELQNPRVVYLDKDLQYHKKFIYKLSGTVTQVTVAIGFALVFKNVWSLVIGSLAGSLIQAIVSYPLDPYLPKFKFNRESAIEMLNFGKWMTGLSISSFLFTQGDDAFLGWFLGATALGFYQMAYQLARAPSTEITQVISQVLFPTYSKIQDDVSALRSAYFRMLKIAITISAPLSVGIVVVSPLFVRIFLGAEWMGAVVPMQILALWGLLLSIGSTSGPLFQARGRPDYITKVNVMKTLALAVLIFPATQRFGVAGTAGAVVCSALLTSEPIINYLAVREVEGRLRTFFWTLSIPLASSAVMAGGLVAVQQGVTIQPNPVHFVLYVATGAVIYILSMLLFEELFGYGSIAEFRSLVKLVT